MKKFPPPVTKWLPPWLVLLTAVLFIAGVTTFEGTVVAMLLMIALMVRQK